jgi:hypothetical protein
LSGCGGLAVSLVFWLNLRVWRVALILLLSLRWIPLLHILRRVVAQSQSLKVLLLLELILKLSPRLPTPGNFALVHSTEVHVLCDRCIVIELLHFLRVTRPILRILMLVSIWRLERTTRRLVIGLNLHRCELFRLLIMLLHGWLLFVLHRLMLSDRLVSIFELLWSLWHVLLRWTHLHGLVLDASWLLRIAVQRAPIRLLGFGVLHGHIVLSCAHSGAFYVVLGLLLLWRLLLQLNRCRVRCPSLR